MEEICANLLVLEFSLLASVVVKSSHLLHPIKPRAVVPQNLLARATRHFHGHEMIDRVGPV